MNRELMILSLLAWTARMLGVAGVVITILIITGAADLSWWWPAGLMASPVAAFLLWVLAVSANTPRPDPNAGAEERP